MTTQSTPTSRNESRNESRNDSQNDSHATELIVVMWILATLAAIVLGRSLFVRAAILHRVRASDYVMIMAFASGVVHNALITEGCRWGIGMHVYYLGEEERRQATKLIFMCEGWGIMSPTFGRIAFCLFLLDFAVTRQEIWSLRFAIGAQALSNSVAVVLTYAQCGSHVSAFWDPNAEAHCWGIAVHGDYSYFQCSWNSFTDLFLTILPAIMLRKLRLDLGKKMAVISLFCLSIVALIASIAKVYLLKEVAAGTDLTWCMVTLMISASVEMFVIIIVASIPTLKPLTLWGRKSSSPEDAEAHGLRNRKDRGAGSWRQWGVSSLMNTASSRPQHIPESSEERMLESDSILLKAPEIHASVTTLEGALPNNGACV